MPNPLRLAVLIELREAAGLNQAQAAECCGLRGRQSRKTLAAWEMGQSTPRQRYRGPVALYLLRDLGLGQDLARFDAIFEILVEEWEWPPLEKEERVDFIRLAGADPQRSLPGSQPHPRITISGDEVPADGFAGTERLAAASWLTAQRMFAGVSVLVLAFVFYLLYTRFIAIPTADKSVTEPLAPATATHTPTPTAVSTSTPTADVPTPNALENLDFESGLAPWDFVGGDGCLYTLQDGDALGNSGRYLSVQRLSSECTSLRKELGQLPKGSDRIGVALWIRSPEGVPIEGELVIWSGRAPLDTVGVEERAEVAFRVQEAGWHCIEAELNYNPQFEWVARAELYFKGETPNSYDIDTAAIRFGAGVICPPPPARLTNGSFEDDSNGPDGWKWWQSPCPFAVIEDAPGSQDGLRYLQVQRADKCTSLLQDIPIRVAADQPFTARVWIKSQANQSVGGILALYASGSTTHAESIEFRAGPSWRCVELSLRVPDSSYTTLRTEIYFDQNALDPVYTIDAAEVEMGETARCPSQALALVNGDFEDAELTGWQIAPCGGEARHSEQSHNGSRLLAVRRDAPDCHSIFQDVGFALTEGDEIQAALWLRSEDGSRLNGRLALWAIGDSPQENSGVDISTEEGRWQCVEVSLAIGQASHSWVRWELYLNSAGPVAYLLDDAQLGLKDEPLCPHTDLSLRTTRISPLRAAYYAGGIIGVDAEVQNLNPTPLPEGAQLAVWLAASFNGPPIDAPLVKSTLLSPLAGAAASSGYIYAEVELPRPLPPGDYFVVWEVVPPPGVGDVDPRNNRDSRPVSVGDCDPQNRYCDVSADSWGGAEIERWFELKISQGCRSNTEPFQDRPFCPDQMVNREVVPVFLLRHIYGGSYAPPDAQGLYADRQEFNGGRDKWAEVLGATGVGLESNRCPSQAEQPVFCPTLWVSRGELLLSLAQSLGWELAPVQGDIFVDVQHDSPIQRAIEAGARKGFLAENDPFCPNRGDGQTFCPDEPARRAFAAVVMARAFAAAPQYPIAE